ncbi:MAG: hypothetical protein AAB472_02545 [Patescibacteria group bacterium]
MDMLDVGQANELKLACRREGFSPEDLKWLCEGSTLSQLRKVRLGHASIEVIAHVIDCDADPFVPDGWSVEEHQKSGSFEWDASKVELWLANGQKNGKILEGNKLRKEMAKKVPFNACVLDYLLANPHLIPQEWKGKYVFFWGTVYRDSRGNLFVRYLYWSGDGWLWGDRWLDDGWRGSYLAALRAS